MSKQVRFKEPEEQQEPTHGKKFKHTLDSDEEDDEVNEELYNVLEEGLEGFEKATVEIDGDIQITPFNLDEEMQTGHFDKDGTYIFKKENADDQDNWLSNIDWSKVKQRAEDDNKKNDDSDSSSESEDEQKINKEDIYKEIIQLVLPGESIQKAIQRYGKICPKIQRGKKRKQQQEDDSVTNDEKIKAKENMLKLSSLADEIVRSGNLDIYEKTFEQITYELSKSNTEIEDVPPEDDMFAS